MICKSQKSQILMVSHASGISGASKVLLDFFLYSQSKAATSFVSFGHGPINMDLKKRGLLSQSIIGSKATQFSNKFIFAFIIDLILSPIFIVHLAYLVFSKSVEKIMWNTATRVYIAVLLSFLTQTELIVYVHEPKLFFEKRFHMRFIYNFWLRRVDKFVVVSKMHIEQLRKASVLENKIHQVNNGLSNSFFGQFETKKDYRYLDKNSKIKILFWASEQNYRKGFDIFFNACQSLETELNLDCFVCGNTSIETFEILGMTNPSSSFNFIGFTPITEIVANDVDLAICPSRSEAQALSVLEMAGLKIPLIVSDIQENKDIFDQNCCWFFANGYVESLRQMILNFLSVEIVNVEKNCNNAFEKVKRQYNSEQNFTKVLEIISY